jgi:hypothetical protein
MHTGAGALRPPRCYTFSMIVTLKFPFRYIAWHYIQGLREAIFFWNRILYFVWHFFSVSLFARTFFAPLEYNEKVLRTSGVDSREATFILRTLLRIVGVFVRKFFISMGLFSTAFVFVIECFALFFWFILPPLLILLSLLVVLLFIRVSAPL